MFIQVSLGDTILDHFFFRTEIEKYRTLHPRTRVLILKALCDIRVEVPHLLYDCILLLKSNV